MKKLTEDLWLIEEGLYAEQRGTQWFVSDEQSEILAGPFDSLESLEASRIEQTLDALDVDTAQVQKLSNGAVAVSLDSLDSTDLVTLREAAEHLPRTHQALYAAQRRGTLKVDPIVEGRTMKLYSLKALKEAYPE